MSVQVDEVLFARKRKPWNHAKENLGINGVPLRQHSAQVEVASAPYVRVALQNAFAKVLQTFATTDDADWSLREQREGAPLQWSFFFSVCSYFAQKL